MRISSLSGKSLLILTTTSLLAIPNVATTRQNPAPPSAHEGHAQQTTPATKPNVSSATQVSTTMNLLGETNVLLDPACNACKGAGAELRVHSHAASGVEEPLQLRAENLMSSAGDEVANVRTVVGPIDPAKPLPADVKRGDVVGFRVKVTGVLSPGSWKTRIFNGDKLLGSVQFTLPAISFNVKLDTGDTGQPSITVTRGEQKTILLKNDDAVGYQIQWELITGPTALPVKGEGKLVANGELPIPVEPRIEWFSEANVDPCWEISKTIEAATRIPCNLRAVFKDKEADGVLTIRLHSKDCTNDAGAPSKVFRIKTSLAYYGPLKKAWWSYLFTLLLLFAGAFLSLYVNYKLPDEEIRADMRKQLSQIGRDVTDLSMRLASRLRVLVGIECRIIRNQLSQLKWYTPDFDKKRSDQSDAIEKLGRRVVLLRQMGRLRESYEALMTLDVPPTIMDSLESNFEQIGELLDDFQVSDADLQEAGSRLADLKKKIATWSQPALPDPTLAQHIYSSLQSLNRDLQTNGVLSKSVTFKGIREGTFKLLVDQLVEPPRNPSDVPANDYYRLDVLGFRGNLLRTYVLLCDLRASLTEELRPQAKEDDLFKKLRIESWDGLRKARRLVWEMSEQCYSDDVKSAILQGKVKIRLDRNHVRAYETALFDLEFDDKQLDTAAARDEWSCTWNFGHGPIPGVKCDKTGFLEEQGWSVAHYFPKRGSYDIYAHFSHEETGDLKNGKGEFVSPKRTQVVWAADDEPEAPGILPRLEKKLSMAKASLAGNLYSLLRLFLALIPAVLGLWAGAKDEFLKLDLAPALVAIFLLGFGSDTVKNLLSQKPKS